VLTCAYCSTITYGNTLASPGLGHVTFFSIAFEMECTHGRFTLTTCNLYDISLDTLFEDV
jgi:hypothetical protein